MDAVLEFMPDQNRGEVKLVELDGETGRPVAEVTDVES
jgi:hypothetical protein